MLIKFGASSNHLVSPGRNLNLAIASNVDLKSLLPAGEWAEVEVLTDAVGMMANHDWAIFARALRIRDGGTRAFIKYFICAQPSDGPGTILMTGEHRLGRLKERLIQLQQNPLGIPSVRLLEVRSVGRDLLVAMEEVDVLDVQIDEPGARDLSLRVISDLDPRKASGIGWFHFDICPKNIGLRGDGSCVLIDLDGLYLGADRPNFEVSAPAWKSFRAPRALVEEVNNALISGGVISQELAMRKARYEIILVAAECVIGPLQFGRQFLDLTTLNKWLDTRDPDDEFAEFWATTLRGIFGSNCVPELDVVHEAASPIYQKYRGLATNVREASGGGEVKAVAAPKTNLGEERSNDLRLVGSLTPWSTLGDFPERLRAGKLTIREVTEYKEKLAALLDAFPGELALWDEIVLVLISYQKDPVEAANILNRALQFHGSNRGLVQMQKIVQAWLLRQT